MKPSHTLTRDRLPLGDRVPQITVFRVPNRNAAAAIRCMRYGCPFTGQWLAYPYKKASQGMYFHVPSQEVERFKLTAGSLPGGYLEVFPA